MREFLLFDLWGPLAAWGSTAVGELRPTSHHPTRSALLGLVSAALGLRRGDDDAHRALGRMLRFAIRIDRPADILEDFHTAQGRRPRRMERFATRAGELGVPRHALDTVVSRRSYATDGGYRVASWATEVSPWSLARIAQALDNPVFPLYLGRRSCPPGLPLDPRLVQAESLPHAWAILDSYWSQHRAGSAGSPFAAVFDRRQPRQIVWDDPNADVIAVSEFQIAQRYDEPVSRRRRTFGASREARASEEAVRDPHATDAD
jgi:CRISPR system Cascade subunit CasD